MDDTLIFGRDQQEHDIRLQAVLQRIQDAGITLNKDKCEFGRKSITFLGHVVDGQGISSDPNKTSAIRQMGRRQSYVDSWG